MSDIDQRIKEANGRLKSNYCGVRIVRTLNVGLDISLAAQQMGHSLKIHSEIYHTWISANVHRDAFNKIMGKNP